MGAAALLMGLGIWLHPTGRHDQVHAHAHVHARLIHRHRHYPNIHHRGHPH